MKMRKLIIHNTTTIAFFCGQKCKIDALAQARNIGAKLNCANTATKKATACVIFSLKNNFKAIFIFITVILLFTNTKIFSQSTDTIVELNDYNFAGSLKNFNIDFVEIYGNWEERFEQAKKMILLLMKKNKK